MDKGGAEIKIVDGVVKIEASYGEVGKYKGSLAIEVELMALIQKYVESTENKTDDAVAAIALPILKDLLSKIPAKQI